MEPAFVAECMAGVELIYQRNYKGARDRFAALEQRWPGTGVAAGAQVLVWQALMLENFDFRYDRQYRTSLEVARGQLEQQLQRPGNQAWENFLLGGLFGVDSIHSMRKEDFLVALQRGYDAVRFIAESRRLAPAFADPALGEALFQYWSAVISHQSKALPDLPDRRAEAVQQMRRIEGQGIFLSAPATMALTWTWLEEERWDLALETALRNHRAWPDNIILALVLGRVHANAGRLSDAEQIYLSVTRKAPENQRVHYYLGRLYLRWKKNPEALASLDHYLAFPDLDRRAQAEGHFQRGRALERLSRPAEAMQSYQEAWKLGRVEGARRRLEKLQTAQPGAATR
jgi:tetratricopeptide (TPR) repeat protein